MKAKTVISGILSCLLLFTALAACGKGEGQKEPNVESSQVQQIEEEPGKHLLYVYDAGKNPEMTATFYNSMTGKSEDVVMQKVSEDDGHITYACNGDYNVYNMVHMTYGSESTMNVAFNRFVSGWYLRYGELLPYVEGETPAYKPAYETKVFQFDGYDKKVYIWTPKDYDPNAEEKFSTIYMLDGQSVLSTEIDNPFNQGVWNVSEHVESMMSQTDYKAIVVAIETTGSRRNDELIPDLGEIPEWANITVILIRVNFPEYPFPKYPFL